MAIAMVTVLLSSCEKETIVTEEEQIENTQNLSSAGIMSRSNCDKWVVPKNEHKLSSQKSITLTTQTQAFKAPNDCAKRGFKYKTGTVIKASHKIGNYYWITAPGYFSGADDTGWIAIPNSSTTGSTTTNFDCSKWLVPKNEHKLSSPKSLTLTSQTQAYKAPGTCAPRGFKYTSGTQVKATHKIDNFYWITAPGYFSGADDTGWIAIPNSSTTGSTNTNTTNTTSTNTNTNNSTTGFDPKPQNNPFICDGTSKTVGHFTGFLPGETVRVSWSSNKPPSKKVADSNGRRSITWSCNYFSDLDLVAYGETSGKTFTYPFKTGSNSSTGGTSGGTSSGNNTNNSNVSTGNTNTGNNTNNSNNSHCKGESTYTVTPYNATIKDYGSNAGIIVYKAPKTPYSCAETVSIIEQGSKIRITKEARGYVYFDNKYTDNKKGWVRESTISNNCGAFRVDPKGDAGINPIIYIKVGDCDDKQRIVIPNLKLKRGTNCSDEHETVVFDLDLTFHLAQNKVIIDHAIIDVSLGTPGDYMTFFGLKGFLKEYGHNRYYVHWNALISSDDLSKYVWSTNFNTKNQAGLSLGLRYSVECTAGFVAVFEK